MSIERKHRSQRLPAVVLLAALAVVTAGCLETHKETPAEPHPCTACHGDARRAGDRVTQAAPPFDLDGNTEPSARGVGAHQTHLTPSATHTAVACTECHTVPDEVFSPGHLDNKDGAKITFGDLARSNDSSPVYDAAGNSCSNTYCHQAYAPDNRPEWRAPKDSNQACGSCHGLPPAPPHPQSDQCFQCHGQVIDQDRHFVNKGLHIDGQVEKGNLACNSCHGTDPGGGPPPDLEGNIDSRFPGVGAHGIHLNDSATHAAIACSTCHVVPPTVDSPGHIDATRPADISFSGLATQANGSPAYDFTAHTCSGAYCHGSATPVWNAPRSSADACGSCHGLPPPAPHPQRTDCSQCHSQVIDASRNFVNPALHVDGIVEKTPACGSCHGDVNRSGDDPTKAAPPADLSGNTDVSAPGVGAHQRHLQASNTHGPVACNQCHVVPSAWDSEGHNVTGLPPATITFGNFEQDNNLTAVYSFADHTCSNTYCHSYYSPTSYMPNWVSQITPNQTCGTCHDRPPPFVPNASPPISAQSHPKMPKVPDCSRCHGDVIDSSGNFTNAALHVDGHVDVKLACNSCHGSATSFAPPNDLAGNTSVTSIGVGAHQTHVTGGQVSRPVPCRECHVVPSNVNDPGHIDDWGTAEITFSGAATIGGHVPGWNRQTATCTDSWCHGPVTAGNTSPVWTDPSVALTCTNCHGLPPPDPHPQVSQNPLVAQCWICHSNITQGFGFVDRTLHVNGSVDF